MEYNVLMALASREVKMMLKKYLVDENGHKSAVVLDLETYRALMEHLEKLEDTLELDEAVRSAKSFRSYEDIRAEMQRTGSL